MIPGYQNDDKYRMVEDDFYSIAQSFTAHLHHAEYRRRKKQAKAAAARDGTPTGVQNANGDMKMRVETKRKIQARELHARQRDAVGDVAKPAWKSGKKGDDGGSLVVSGKQKGRRKGEAETEENDVDEDEDEEDEENKDEDNDPWLGTSLAGLMTDIRRDRKKTALVGLERIQSSTKAARGLNRGFLTGDEWREKEEKKNVAIEARETADKGGSRQPASTSASMDHPRFQKPQQQQQHPQHKQPSSSSLLTTATQRFFHHLDNNDDEYGEDEKDKCTNNHRSIHVPRQHSTISGKRRRPPPPNGREDQYKDKGIMSRARRREEGGSSKQQNDEGGRKKEKKMQMIDVPTFLL